MIHTPGVEGVGSSSIMRLYEPRKAEEIARHCGVSKGMVHQVISTYNRFGLSPPQSSRLAKADVSPRTSPSGPARAGTVKKNFEAQVQAVVATRPVEDERPVLIMAQDEGCFPRSDKNSQSGYNTGMNQAMLLKLAPTPERSNLCRRRDEHKKSRI